MQREGGLIVGVEVGPVHRHHDLAPLAHDLANPRTEDWFDWALLATVAAWLAFFPGAIPVVFYHL